MCALQGQSLLCRGLWCISSATCALPVDVLLPILYPAQVPLADCTDRAHHAAPGLQIAVRCVNVPCLVAEVSKDDMDLGDEDLDAGAWGDPDLDIVAGEPADANGIAEIDNENGEDVEDAEGGWEMEVCMLGIWLDHRP